MKKLLSILILLVASNASAQSPLWNFSRTTTAKKSLSTGGIQDTAINIPRVGGEGGGLEIEGQATQLHGFTEAFGSWTSTDCAITSNVAIAPDGTLTADLLDNTAATDGRSSVLTTSLGSLAGRKFTGSVYVKADTRHKITIRLYEDGIAEVASTTQFVDSDWQRVIVTGTFTGGGTGKTRFYVHPGEYTIASGLAYFWGANLTEGSFASSYIQNTGGETTQITRTADNMTTDPNPTSTTNWILPERFCGTCAASKLTIELEAKCSFSGVTDIGINRTLIGFGNDVNTVPSMVFYFASVGKLLSLTYTDTDLKYNASSYAGYSLNQWHKYKFFFDFSDWSRSNTWVDNIPVVKTDSEHEAGSDSFTSSSYKIKIGSPNFGPTNSECRIRNLRIEPVEF